MNFKCPFCGSDVRERHGEFGLFIGCTEYPKCRFTLNLNGDENEEEIKNKIDEQKKIYKFLNLKHDPKECKKCHGEQETDDFYYSLYHFMMSKGYITKKQHDAIREQITDHFNPNENKAYKYPILDEPTGEEEALLRKNGLW